MANTRETVSKVRKTAIGFLERWSDIIDELMSFTEEDPEVGVILSRLKVDIENALFDLKFKLKKVEAKEGEISYEYGGLGT